MIDLISELAKFFEPELRLQILSSNSIRIKEEQNIDKSGTLIELNIKGLPQNSIAFTLDFHTKDKAKRVQMMRKYGQKCLKKLSWPIKDDYMDVNRTCDFIIFSKQEQKYNILVGELKSSLKSDKISTQLINSQIYIDYVLNLLKTAHNVSIEPVYKLAVFVNRKDKNFNSNSIKGFYKKRLLDQNMQQNFRKDKEILPFVLPAPSGIANCEYDDIVGRY